MQHARWLIESRPFLTRIPDDDLIVPDEVPTAAPGTGRSRFTATRDTAGTYGMIYVPVGRPFTGKTSLLSAKNLTAWWFNPRDGRALKIDDFENTGKRRFLPPDPRRGTGLDSRAGRFV